ncbi:TIR domain-containing protein [Brevundimonas sp. NPDC092305]|uniref:TIR domain-containing protein n=1 Tax=Brevundimonas sp. NPDC092305 TaxID=3363957 RepID=UPI003805074D
MPKSGFISWSGDESRTIAENLKQLFGFVLASPQLFVASKDLKAGDVWFTEIAAQLDACDVGVIVVTPQNLTRPWLHFEAGAIAKRVGRSAAIPLLCGVSTGELANTPLAQLQALSTSHVDIQALCHRLNELLELGLQESHIDTAFPVWWERFEGGINNPDLWKGVKKERSSPTTADLSVQLTQIASALSDISDRLPARVPPPSAEMIARVLQQLEADQLATPNALRTYQRPFGVGLLGGLDTLPAPPPPPPPPSKMPPPPRGLASAPSAPPPPTVGKRSTF